MRTQRSTRRGKHTVGPLTVAVLVAACQGPVAPLTMGMNDRPVDLLLGEKVRAVTALPQSMPIALPRAIPYRHREPAPVETIYIDPDSGPAPQLPPCAPSPTIRIPDAERASLMPAGPPAEATYLFDTFGFGLSLDESNTDPSDPFGSLEVSVLPLVTSRTIENVTAEQALPTDNSDTPGSYVYPYTFDVAWTADERTSTSRYRTVFGPDLGPDPDVPGDQPAAAPLIEEVEGVGHRFEPGLYVLQWDTSTADGTRLPDPGMKLVEFPIRSGEQFNARVTDGVNTIEYTSTVARDPEAVNVCPDDPDTVKAGTAGVYIEGWPVTIAGTVVSADPEFMGHQLLEFEAQYVIAPQFGGLIIKESMTATNPSDQAYRDEDGPAPCDIGLGTETVPCVPPLPLRSTMASIKQKPLPVTEPTS